MKPKRGTGNLRTLLAAAVLLSMATADPAAGQQKGFEFDFGGRIMNDWTFVSTDLPAFEDTVEFRRARLFVSGKLYERVGFKMQIDFATGEVDLKDVYLNISGLPKVGKIQVGHFLEPFSLELMTSSRFITFAERGLPTVFTQGRNVGAMVQNSVYDNRLQWALGAFRLTDDTGRNVTSEGEVAGGDFNYGGRISGTPWTRDNFKQLFHLGLGLTMMDRDDTGVRFRARPEAHFLPRVVDTGALDATAARIVGLEAAYKRNAFSIQAEHMMADVDDPASSAFSGSYLFVSYFPTGEHRPYSASKGGFGRVRPKSDFLSGPGHRRGAWELAARFSTIDLDDGVIAGGTLDDLTLGVNWYLNPRTRTMFNYVRADRQGVGTADIFVTRFQVDF